VEVGGSSPLTSTVYFGFVRLFAYGQSADLRVLCWAPPSSTGFIDGICRRVIKVALGSITRASTRHPHGHAGTLGRVRLVGVTVPCAALPQPWRLH
jgi:hypothetical protein